MDLHGIDLNLLVAFDALMSERSVTKAGRRIGRTQPAMSAALARLRSLLNDELFVRSQSGLQPTPRATDLSLPLGRALQDIQRTLGFAQQFDPRLSPITFKIGLSEHPAFKLLPQITNRLRDCSPTITLHVRCFIAREEALAMLDAGEADVVVGVPPRSAPGRILTKPLFDENFVCVVRKGHPAAAKLTLDAYLGLDHLLVSPEADRFGHVDTALAERGLRRHLAVTLPQMYAAPRLISQTDMIATLMEGVVEASGYGHLLTCCPPPIEIVSVPFIMCWHRRNDAHPAQQWLRNRIAESPRAIADHSGSYSGGGGEVSVRRETEHAPARGRPPGALVRSPLAGTDPA